MGAKTKAVSITDTIEFRHHYLTQPSLKPQDQLIHVLQTLTAAMHHASAIYSTQLIQQIGHLHHLFQKWRATKTTPSPKPHTSPKVTRPDVTRAPQDKTVEKPSRQQRHQQSPRVTPTSHIPTRNAYGVQYNLRSQKGPRHPYPTVSAPIDNRTRS